MALMTFICHTLSMITDSSLLDKRIISKLKDKDYNEMLTQMLPFADSFVTIEPDNPRAMSAEECAEAIRACGFGGEVVVSTDTGQAVSDALQRAKEQSIGVCAFGSLYSVGALKSAIKEEKSNG